MGDFHIGTLSTTGSSQPRRERQRQVNEIFKKLKWYMSFVKKTFSILYEQLVCWYAYGVSLHLNSWLGVITCL